MFVIFGTRIKSKIIAAKRDSCLGCNKPTEHELEETSKWLTLFLLPVVSYKSEFIVRCKACGLDNNVSETRSRSFQRNAKLLEK